VISLIAYALISLFIVTIIWFVMNFIVSFLFRYITWLEAGQIFIAIVLFKKLFQLLD